MFFKDLTLNDNFKFHIENNFFPFHLVEKSPWPLYTSLATFCSAVGVLSVLYFNNMALLFAGITFLGVCFFGWQKDILKEAFLEGSHTLRVQNSLNLGIILFITSEIFFFFSFFWSLYFYKASPVVFIGGWPPLGVVNVQPLCAPLLGTLVLLTSGVSITWSHYALLEGGWKESFLGLLFTVSLGLLFSGIQLAEYLSSSFTIADSVYGSAFFLLTGFHGFHVLVGSTFLAVCLLRFLMNTNFMSSHHVGFEAACWYWHFVDVVWLFLFSFLYF